MRLLTILLPVLVVGFVHGFVAPLASRSIGLQHGEIVSRTKHPISTFVVPKFAADVRERRNLGLKMGRVGGGSGWSRSVNDNKDETSPPSKALARPGGKPTSSAWEKKQNAVKGDSDDKVKKRKWLSIFDFDGTLFRAPIRFFKGGAIDPPNAAIKPPLVPSIPSDEWFDLEMVQVVRERVASEDHTAVLLSERPELLESRIREICGAQGMTFDQVVLRPDGKQKDSPASFKAKWVRKLLKHLRLSEDKDAMAEVWDDDAECRYDMGRIEGVIVHAVVGRYGPPMEVGGNVAGFKPDDDSVTFPSSDSSQDDHSEEMGSCTYGYALAQGRRDYMEDRCVAKKLKLVDGGVGRMFAIFDGHGGEATADWACKYLWRNLEDLLVRGEPPEDALRSAFEKTDKDWCTFAKEHGGDESGSTALVALVMDQSIYLASAGDGSAVVYRKDDDPVMISTPHRPDMASEKKRILSLGGQVVQSDCARVNGILAVSRGFGDLPLKRWVPSDPDIQRWDVTAGDTALVIASDGMTDTLLEKQVKQVLDASPNVEAAAKELVDVALAEGTNDNVGVLVLDLASILKHHSVPSSASMSQPLPEQQRQLEQNLALSAVEPPPRLDRDDRSNKMAEQKQIMDGDGVVSVGGSQGAKALRAPAESSSTLIAFDRNSRDEGFMDVAGPVAV